MVTEIVKTDRDNPNKQLIRKIAQKIKNGYLVIYPTETCYGIGTNILNVDAVKRVYTVKKRPFTSPLTAVVSSLKMAKKYGYIDKKVEYLVKKYMPGPLTLVVEKKSTVPDIFDPKEFAFRISGNKVALELVKAVKVPIVATSANIHGKSPIYSSKEVIEVFNGKVDVILDVGDLEKVKPSTVIALIDDNIEIRREGPISSKKILEELMKW